MLANVVWHYWIAVALAVPSVLAIVLTIIGYVVKVVMPRYQQR